jgi:hypothetical protein
MVGRYRPIINHKLNNQEIPMNTKQKTRWWVDAVLFIGFIATFFLDFTGVELHQLIGVFGGALAVYHLLSHWDWVSAVTQRFFGRTSGKARQYYVIDAVMLIGFVVIAGTGLVISTWLNLTLTHFTTWLTVHIAASIITLLVLVLKLTLHSRWIASAARGAFALQAPQPSRLAVAPVRAGSRPVSRREFLEVMGVAGAASLLALVQGADSLMSLSGGGAQAASQASSGAASTSSQSASAITSSSSNAASTCSVRCNRGCSYPGHCRKYVDSNNNNYCDLGECA